MGADTGPRLTLAWLRAGLPLVQSWEAGEISELAALLEPLALECHLPDFAQRADERWAQTERTLPRHRVALRHLRSTPAGRAHRRGLLLLHRGWRQLMLLAPADLKRARALAHALALWPSTGALEAYYVCYRDGAGYLQAALAMPLIEVQQWLIPKD